MVNKLIRPIEYNLAVALDNLHPLCFSCPEVIAAGQDDTYGLMFPFLGNDGVGNDPSFELNIGLGVNSSVGEFHKM